MLGRPDISSQAGDFEFSVAVRDVDAETAGGVVGTIRYCPRLEHRDRVWADAERAFTGPSRLVESASFVGGRRPSRVLMEAAYEAILAGPAIRRMRSGSASLR